ncbi:MAG: MFS transporter [Gammaproteobacteria bacterium]|nr:MFS transporter [Gammaproteobacteria bacterium]
MLDRAKAIDEQFIRCLREGRFPESQSRITPAVAGMSKQIFIELFESQMVSRQLDLMARVLKDQGLGFYTIGSSGHEGNAAVARVFRHTDMAFLHYRSGAFMAERARHVTGVNPIRDQMLSLVASSDDRISQGRHKVFGSVELFVPPQTSTIASHLPKAAGAAWAIKQTKDLDVAKPVPDDSVILCSFGDASLNHATAQTALNFASHCAYRGMDLPIVFLCEDNGIGISTPTPDGWVKSSVAQRPGLNYVYGNGLHLPDVYLAAQEAEELARQERKPVFLHIKTVRLAGHAGSDVESQYKPQSAIEANEAQDPLLHSARIAIENGFLSKDEIIARYEALREEVVREAEDCLKRPKLTKVEDIVASLAPQRPAQPVPAVASAERRQAAFGPNWKNLAQPRNLCQHINFALTDLFLQYPNAFALGEDVGKKGGVYRVTADLQARFSDKRVIDTLLDETSILGLAMGGAHLGLLPVPEIQFLAYTVNAFDQIRGEAATLSFFSSGQYTNPMVLRIASLAYQKGFGGHFHNDNAFAFLRETPGMIIAVPSNGPDAAKMLRTCMREAQEQKRIVAFMEPIALYMTKDLHEKGDNGWLFEYPDPAECIELGEVGVFGDSEELVILTYGNGYYLSRQAEKILKEQHGKSVKLVDLRWLAPLPVEAILREVDTLPKVLIVDESRHTGGPAEQIITALVENMESLPKVKRVCGVDSFITIGESWQYLLPSTEDIVQAALAI